MLPKELLSKLENGSKERIIESLNNSHTTKPSQPIADWSGLSAILASNQSNFIQQGQWQSNQQQWTQPTRF